MLKILYVACVPCACVMCLCVMLPRLQVMLQMCPECDVKKIPKSGPAPVLLRPHELAMVGPDWESYTAWIEGNANAKQVLGRASTHSQAVVTCQLR